MNLYMSKKFKNSSSKIFGLWFGLFDLCWSFYDFQVRLWVAAFLAFLVLKFWKCGKMWPSISKWTYTCQKNLKIQVRKYSAFDLAFLTFVGLFKILLRSLRCKKSGGMQESCTLAFYHQKQFSLKISHFESVCIEDDTFIGNFDF